MVKILTFQEEVGCDVVLLESNVKALLPLVDFSKKKIKKSLASYFKIEEEVPAMVSQLEFDESGQPSFVTVSTKDVSDTEATACRIEYDTRNRLMQMSKRLAYLSEGKLTEEQWTDFFQGAITYEMIADREKFEGFASRLEAKNAYIDVIRSNYVKLFGIQTTTCSCKITIQSFSFDGNDLVRGSLSKIMKKYLPMEKGKVYTKDELYNDDTRYNADLRLILPDFQFVVTAYNKSLCHDVINRFCKAVEDQRFDYFQRQLESV